MLSLTAVLASLPPASLAETDLPRFVAQTLGRRTRAELPGLASLFAEEPLRGYPPGIGAILAAACETLVAEHLEPQLLDSRSCDGLLGSRAFIARLEARVEVRRQRLRPGTLIAGDLRHTLGSRLTILPGVGRELMLISPVDLAQVPDARYAMPLTVVIAKPGSAAEGETYRTLWAPIEEAFGLSGPLAQRWTARYFAIARRENHDARVVRDGLSPLTPDTRRRLWDTLVGHLRDTELPEQHRPGRRGLENRLAALGLELDRPWMEPLIGLVESTYRAAGIDPDVTAGRCPCPREDLIRWSGWVDVPTAQKKALLELDPTEIEHLLIELAETEHGRADGLIDESLRRPLASLRDGCLRPRWQRSQGALQGIDPLALAESRIASGDDRQTIAERLTALAEEASAELRARAAEEALPGPRKVAPPQTGRPRATPDTTAKPQPTKSATLTGRRATSLLGRADASTAVSLVRGAAPLHEGDLARLDATSPGLEARAGLASASDRDLRHLEDEDYDPGLASHSDLTDHHHESAPPETNAPALDLDGLVTDDADDTDGPADRVRLSDDTDDTDGPADRVRLSDDADTPDTGEGTDLSTASTDHDPDAEDHLAAAEPRPGLQAVAPPRFQLPPMPDIPPPRPAPRVRPRTGFPSLPPMPAAPLRDRPPTAGASRIPAPRPARAVTSIPSSGAPSTSGPASPRTGAPTAARPTSPPSSAPAARPESTASPAPRPQPTAAPRPRPQPTRDASPAARPRLQTTPHLVTPTQGNEFYDAAFRELELLERDLLQRGPTTQAIERCDAISREARELHAALGPSARSGDREFLAAQRRIDKVLDYLERLQPLLQGDPQPSAPSLGKRLIGLFRKR